MSRLSTNLAASFFSRGYSAVLSIAFVPVYIRLLGVEAYGLIGAFAALQAFLSLLDLGLGSTLSREFARAHSPAEISMMRDLLRTLEGIYWAVALLIALFVWSLSGFIAAYWLQPVQLSPAEVERSLGFAGLAFALQWPTNLYSGGFYGLQRQGVLAVVVSVAATARVAITMAALVFISPTLECFFISQAFANALQTVALAVVLWSRLPRSERGARFRPALLRGMMGFAAGMLGISVTAIVLTQLDKVILSKTLTLDAFGFYTIASALAAGLYIFISPLFGVFFPRFSQLVRIGGAGEIERLYRLGNQLMAVIVCPVAAVAALFSTEILRSWTGNEQIAMSSGSLFAMLIVGNALNGLMNIPYAVQLAHGWTSLALYSNVIGIIVFAPLIFFLSVRMGALGGAISWVMLTSAYILISLQVMHRRIPEVGSVWRWYFQDIGVPTLAALVVVIACRRIEYFPGTMIGAGLFLMCIALLAMIAAGLCAPVVRGEVMRRACLSGSLR